MILLTLQGTKVDHNLRIGRLQEMRIHTGDYGLYPNRPSWWLGQREVVCAQPETRSDVGDLHFLGEMLRLLLGNALAKLKAGACALEWGLGGGSGRNWQC